MKVSKIVYTLKNKINEIKCPSKNQQKIKSLCNDMTSLDYKNAQIKYIDKDNVRIYAEKLNGEMVIDLDFAKKIQIQVEKTKDILETVLNSYIETERKFVGKINGTAKRARITRKKSNKTGAYVLITDIENFVSGNSFRRVKNSMGETKFYRNIDGDFVRMFNKNNK